MRDDTAFLRAICDRPGDDLPRLIFADYLDEQGDGDRAEFIRVQIELARLNPGPKEHRKAANLLRRYRKGTPVPMRANTPAVKLMRGTLLLIAHEDRWVGEFYDAIRWRVDHSFRLTWRRGFVDAIAISARDFLAHAGAIFIAQPVQRVVLAGRAPESGGDEYDTVYGWRHGHRWRCGSSADVPPAPAEIPAGVFGLLNGSGRWRNTYPTESAARDDLSRACVLWGRQQTAALTAAASA